MNDILQELETAYQAISSIPVSGNAVDAMALARVKLRNVHEKLKEIDNSKTSDTEKEV